VDQNPTFGDLGLHSLTHIPGARNQAVLFSLPDDSVLLAFGTGRDAQPVHRDLNDHWKWTDAGWAWIGGSTLGGPYAVQETGTPGIPSASNVPGGRYRPAVATDGNRVFMRGGAGGSSNNGQRADLWRLYRIDCPDGLFADVASACPVGCVSLALDPLFSAAVALNGSFPLG